MDKLDVLRRYFGHRGFREGQEELIDGLLNGRDVFGVMPTGGGKSVCYQLPALMCDGVAVIISPLISLMKDQVMALREAGVPAAALHTGVSAEDARDAWRAVRSGDLKLLYVAPERLLMDGFLGLMRSARISLVAVDEAHCISQWGQDFRQSYLHIPDFINELPSRPPVAAFTATATEKVKRDVERLLGLNDPVRVTTGFDRPNLYFDVLRPKIKKVELLKLLGERDGRTGIVYCATRREVEEICDMLRGNGFAATRYHAGLSDEERRANQEDFVYDKSTIMVATNAFGMGIDKSNVSFVIHYNMPRSIEAYYQEAGRAGRDGSPADCIMLYSGKDVAIGRFFIEKDVENDELSPEERERVRAADTERLRKIEGYALTESCYRGRILDYFGQKHPQGCGNCGNCRAIRSEHDITREAQMALSCIKRVKDRLGYSVGKGLIADTLKGSGGRAKERGLDKLTTYGLMKNLKKAEILDYLDALIDRGYIAVDPDFSTLVLTEKAGEVLFRGERVCVTRKLPPVDAKKDKTKPAEDAGSGLYERLRILRARLAAEQGKPAYVIFSNASLADMAEKAPANMEEFKTVSGVGVHRAKLYGKLFLEEIRKYRSDQ